MFDIADVNSISVYSCWHFFYYNSFDARFLACESCRHHRLVAQQRTGSGADTHVARRRPVPTLTTTRRIITVVAAAASGRETVPCH